MTGYRERRKEIYDPIDEEGIFTWGLLQEEEYALASIHLVRETFREEIAYATERLGAIFHKTAHVVQKGSTELLRELGIPEATWNSVRLTIDLEAPTGIGRFDFASTANGLKMLEFNSDTPTTVVEAYHVNERVCQFFGIRNPNCGLYKNIAPAFQSMVNAYRQQGYPCKSIAFSSLDWHREDAGTTQYLLKQSGFNAKFTSLTSLAVKGDSLFSYDRIKEQYIPIDCLYRLHGLEILAVEQDVNGYLTGEHILQLIADRKLAVMNPPSAFVCQTKALQALIWSLSETDTFFEQEEKELIQTYMLPTYLEDVFRGKRAYVKKPIFGREGAGITLYQVDGRPVVIGSNKEYNHQKMIYQEKVDLEVVEVETLKGPFHGSLLWGSFLLNGKASAIVARVDQQITGNDAYYLPVGLKD